MRKLIVGTFVTVDGVMQGPGGPDEDRDGGFTHGGWSATYWDDMMGAVITEQMLEAETLLLGRRTYDIFASHWPRITDPNDPVAVKLNSVKKYVVSRTLGTAEWNNSVVIRDAATDVAKLKAQPGGQIQVSGSCGLIQSLLRHDLIDEFRLWIFPLVLGPGKRLFGEGTLPSAFTLTDTKVSTTGVVLQRYERTGKPQYGSFALDQ